MMKTLKTYESFVYEDDYKQDNMTIFKAIIEQNIEYVKQYISDGGDLGENNDKTPLMRSVDMKKDKSSDEITYLLIEAGSDINWRNSSGISILIRAIQRNKADIVFKLIDLGCDINHQDKYKNCPLNQSLIIADGYPNDNDEKFLLYDKLISRPDIDLDIKKNNPMVWMSVHKFHDRMKDLLERGVNPNIQMINYSRYSTLGYVAVHIKWTLDNEPLHMDDNNEIQILKTMCDYGSEWDIYFYKKLDKEVLKMFIDEYPELYQGYMKKQKAKEFNL